MNIFFPIIIKKQERNEIATYTFHPKNERQGNGAQTAESLHFKHSLSWINSYSSVFLFVMSVRSCCQDIHPYKNFSFSYWAIVSQHI